MVSGGLVQNRKQWVNYADHTSDFRHLLPDFGRTLTGS